MANIDPDTISNAGNNWLAFSGGPDSACLLHLLAASDLRERVRVVHVDHGLDPESCSRARLAVKIAAAMGVDCRVERLDAVELSAPGGREAAARHARYSRFQSLMEADDHVLTAHHQDDQVETFMLRLLRGSGPEGLRGMQPLRRLTPGWLGRPLLAWSRSDIMDYLALHRIDYLVDPTNEDCSLDRNYLRHRVLPEIAGRWPGYRTSILQAAKWQEAAAVAMQEKAEQTLDELSCTREDAGESLLDLTGWLALDAFPSFAVIRAWCRRRAVAPPPTRSLSEFRVQCRSADHDRQPALDWPKARLHAWRTSLWLDPRPAISDKWRTEWPDGDQCPIPAGGALVWSGIERREIGEHWQLSSPPKGARLRLHPGAPKKAIAELMREAGIPPWRRHAYPALSIDGRLCAVGVEWMARDFAEMLDRSGSRLRWHQRPAALIT